MHTSRILFTLSMCAMLFSGSLAAQSLDERLRQAEIANHRAQAAYYQAQLEVLRTPEAPQSFGDRVAQNPAAVVGVLGAFVTALVALISFFFNYRATLRQQRDGQFYEALKRFGDKDSALARAGAAGLVGQIGARRSGWFRNRYPYRTTALEQLLAGLALEKKRIVLNSVAESLQALAGIDARAVVEKLYKQNLEMQRDLVRAVSQYYAICGASGGADSSGTLSATSTLTEYPPDGLTALMNRHEAEFTAFLTTTSGEISRVRNEHGDNQLQNVYLAVRRGLVVSARRLKENARVLAIVLRGKTWIGSSRQESLWYLPTRRSWDIRRRGGSPRPRSIVDLDNLFLDGENLAATHFHGVRLQNAQLQWMRGDFARFLDCDLTGVRLDHANLTNAMLNGSTLVKASMKGADLQESWLVRVNLKEADVEDASLYGAKIGSDTNFDTVWWRADFTPSHHHITGAGSDDELVEELIRLYPIRLERGLPHSSVQEIIERAMSTP